jgi:cell division protein FtsB
MFRDKWSGRAANALYAMGVFAGVCYFAWHAIQGDSGFFALLRAEAQETALAEELAGLQAQTWRMENLTLRLSEAYLDHDLLDERARLVLGYMREDEIQVDW